CAYYRGAKNDNANAQAVDEAAIASRIAVDPWRYKGPNAEGRIDPAQTDCGRANPPHAGGDDDQRADDPAVPGTGISGHAVDPWRKEKPHSAKNSEGAGPPRRMSVHAGRCHGFLPLLNFGVWFFFRAGNRVSFRQ